MEPVDPKIVIGFGESHFHVSSSGIAVPGHADGEVFKQ